MTRSSKDSWRNGDYPPRYASRRRKVYYTGIVRLLGLGEAEGETSKEDQGGITPNDESSIVQHGYVDSVLACDVSVGALTVIANRGRGSDNRP